MPTKRNCLAVKILGVIEGKAEGPLAVCVFLIIALAAIALVGLGLRN
ncbi:hypothetical protein NLM27_26725 [Bradyrhizobium sp. CCGB12]|nr:hypothetical protein [Bradyrhizobium sp. CCGB12]MCP3392348.1 hypothetical protein [Bradyrhizobium sp. CCGB12]